MTKQHAGAVGMAIATLVEAFKVPKEDMNDMRILVYEKALKKVPMGLLPAMVDRAIETRAPKYRGWLPSVADLLADAEACRRALVAANPYTGCVECEDSKGFRRVLIDGVERMERCPCAIRHQQKLAQLGAGGGPLALSPAESSELTRIGEDA